MLGNGKSGAAKGIFSAVVIVVNVILFSLCACVFSVKTSAALSAYAESEKAEEVITTEAPTGLEELRTAGDGQLDYWSKSLESFDGRNFGYITPERNQGGLGTCWAYAAIGAVEAGILREGIDKDANRDNLDLDELIAAYACYNRNGKHDPLRLTADDTYSLEGWRSSGGHADEAFMSMTQGFSLGTQVTTEFYRDWAIEEKLSESEYFIQGFRPVAKTKEAIKRAILEYGSVTIEYKAPVSTTQTYLYHGDGSSLGHASLIVGWNDNIKRSNFWPAQPASDGAWIVKNSWGKGGEFVNGTYCFYLAYDSYLGNNLYVVDMDKRENYPNIYYYDGQTANNDTQYITDAHGAIFEAKLSSATEKEQLKAVSFGVRNDRLTADIKVYRHLETNPGNVNDPVNVPDSGTLAAHMENVYFEHNGFYTIDLDTPIDLDQGEYFSIVISGKDEQDNPLFPVYAVDYGDSVNDMTYRLYNGEWTSLKSKGGIYADADTGLCVRLHAITTTVPRPQPLDNDLKYARVEFATRFLYYEKGKAQIPSITVSFGGEILREKIDYSVALSDNKKPGRATVVITGLNNYTGSRRTTFEVAKPEYPKGVTKETIVVYNDTEYLYDIPVPVDWEWSDDNYRLEQGLSSFSHVMKYIGDDADCYRRSSCSVHINKLNYAPPAEIDISEAVAETEGEYKYTGEQIIPIITVTCRGLVLSEGRDYTLTCSENINVGRPTVTIRGKWRYCGQKTLTFEISKADLPEMRPSDTFKVSKSVKKLGEIELDCLNWEWEDPSLEITGDRFSATVVYNGPDKDNYLNTRLSVTVIREEQKDIATLEIELETLSFVYDGREKRPNVIVCDGDKTLENGIDFVTEYLDNTNAGTRASVIVKGINAYSGVITLTFTIERAERSEFAVFQQGWTYGEKSTPRPRVEGEKENADITYLYSADENGEFTEEKPVNAGEYWIKAVISESENYYSREAKTTFVIDKADRPEEMPRDVIVVSRKTESLRSVSLPEGWEWENPNLKLDAESITARAEYFDKTNYKEYGASITVKKETPKDVSLLSVELGETEFVYDGTEKQPEVTVKDETVTLTNGTDYDVIYGDNRDAGVGTVTIVGKNDYVGSAEISFIIAKAKKPAVDTKILLDEKPQTLADVSLPNGFVWTDETLEISASGMFAKAVYMGADAGNYLTTEIYFEIIYNEQSEENPEEKPEQQPEEKPEQQIEPERKDRGWVTYVAVIVPVACGVFALLGFVVLRRIRSRR